ncbi:MAG: metallopeptidase family protein, partial [candidate division WOR-3 bacterium]
ENLSVEVEERPSAEVLERLGVQARSLLGLYQGVPLPKRTVWWNPTGPDRIILYRANILAQTRGPEEIQALVQEVVKHEIGHYFGLSEEELRRAQQTQ